MIVTNKEEESVLKPEGDVFFHIDWKDGRTSKFHIKNRILRNGRINLAKSLANDFGSSYEYFINGMTFGSGGTTGGSPRYVDETREGLFGPVVVTKPIISSINDDMPTQVVFTSVLAFDEGNGSVINEMALKMRNGDYFSMTTFGDITKTSSMQLTVNWSINFV